MAAKAGTLFLSLAAFCLPVLANVAVAEKPRLGGAGFGGGPHRGLVAAKPLMAPRMAGCLCDFRGRFRSTGKERDAETGLDYFEARYLSSAQGRFTSPDVPFAGQKADFPQTWNLYSYARNNPLRYVDPDGRQDLPAQAECNGNQTCIDALNRSTAQFAKGIAAGIVNFPSNTANWLFSDFIQGVQEWTGKDISVPRVMGTEGGFGVAGEAMGGMLAGGALAELAGSAGGSRTLCFGSA